MFIKLIQTPARSLVRQSCSSTTHPSNKQLASPSPGQTCWRKGDSPRPQPTPSHPPRARRLPAGRPRDTRGRPVEPRPGCPRCASTI